MNFVMFLLLFKRSQWWTTLTTTLAFWFPYSVLSNIWLSLKSSWCLYKSPNAKLLSSVSHLHRRLYTTLLSWQQEACTSICCLCGLLEYCYWTKRLGCRSALVILVPINYLCYWLLCKVWSHPKIHYGTTHYLPRNHTYAFQAKEMQISSEARTSCIHLFQSHIWTANYSTWIESWRVWFWHVWRWWHDSLAWRQ